MTKAVVLLSGGTDSTVVMALAAKRFNEILAVSVLYGQKHSIELEAAHEVAIWYNAGHKVVEMPDIFKGSGKSTLVDDGLEQPHLTYEEILASKGPSPTVVPFRNANLISAATAIAVVEGASHVFVGPHATDAHNWAYPDCSPEFLGAMANAVYVGTYREVRLEFPLVWMTKEDVVAKGLELGVPFHLTHSCYEGIRPQCGKCPTCVERIAAFKASSVVDPVPYAVDTDWTGCRETVWGWASHE